MLIPSMTVEFEDLYGLKKLIIRLWGMSKVFFGLDQTTLSRSHSD